MMTNMIYNFSATLFAWFKRFKSAFKAEQLRQAHIYRLVGTSETSSGEVKAKVQVIGQRTVFTKPIKSIYEDKHYLEQFSSKDIAYIGLIYGFEKGKNTEQIKQLPIRSLYSYKLLPIISMLFITALLLSNTVSPKLVDIAGNVLPAGIFFFSFTYIFADILTEVYGFKQSRRIIWTGFLCNVIFFLGLQFTVFLPPSSHWPLQNEFTQIIGTVPRIIFASMVAYFAGEFLNSYILAKLKILSRGKHLWFRVISSTCIGVAIDSTLFCTLAFAFTVPWSVIVALILIQYVVKMAYQIVILPLTIVLTAYLKKVEQVDYYDYHTNFTPFSLSLEDGPNSKVVPLKTKTRLH